MFLLGRVVSDVTLGSEIIASQGQAQAPWHSQAGSPDEHEHEQPSIPKQHNPLLRNVSEKKNQTYKIPSKKISPPKGQLMSFTLRMSKLTILLRISYAFSEKTNCFR